MRRINPHSIRSILIGMAIILATLVFAVPVRAGGDGSEGDKDHPKEKPHQCKVLPCPVCHKQKPAVVTYSGRAIAVNLTNLHMGPPRIVIGDTGCLPKKGGMLHVSVQDTNVDNGLIIRVADSDTHGVDNEARAEVDIEGFDITLVTTNNVNHRLVIDSIQVDASATCTSNGVVLTGGIEIPNLTLDGTNITVTGEANQVLTFDDFTLVFNEQSSGATATTGFATIAAIHIIVNGCMQGVIGYVHADISCTGMNVPGPTDCSADWITGGGWIRTSGGAKANFGVGGGIRNGAFWGHLNYIDHGTGMHVKGKKVTNYVVVDEVTRAIDYTVTINKKPGTAHVMVADNGEPGRNDTFSIELSTGYSQSGTLGGTICTTTSAKGKKSVKHCSCDNNGGGGGEDDDDDDNDHGGGGGDHDGCKNAGGGNIQLHKPKCDNSQG